MSDNEYTKSQLLSENQLLTENLAKCVEEKNFVWSLWKKLQTEKPDLSSVVSLVMTREKEKTEQRDSKVLNILENKDVEIDQLKKEKIDIVEKLREKDKEVENYGLRLHDLLIEKANLQGNLEKVKEEYEERTKVLAEENGYLSEVVRARQLQHENDQEKYKTKIEDVELERKELHNVVKDLESRLNKLSEDQFIHDDIIEENTLLKEQLKTCQEKLLCITEEHEDATSTLKLRESQLQKHSSVIQQQKKSLKDKDNLLIALKNEVDELTIAHAQCTEHAKEQTLLIENLQSLQEQTSVVIRGQEEQFRSKITILQQELEGKVKTNEALENTVQQLNKGCTKCVNVEQDLLTVKERNEELFDVLQEKNRRISALEKTLKSKSCQDDKNSDTLNNCDVLGRKYKMSEEKVFELKKVLEFKQKEFDALTSAHSNRLERYKNLQKEHKIVLKQLETYENSSDGEVKKKLEEEVVLRALPRSLQKENSDTVWNELQYYKKEYEKLAQERDDVMEEIDILRVEHANDVTTIHELRMCLEDEKRDLIEEIKINNKTDRDEIKKEIRKVENEKNDALKQIELFKKNRNISDKEMEALKKIVKEQEEIVENLEIEVSKYKKELKSIKSKEKKRVEQDKNSKEVVEISEMNDGSENKAKIISSNKEIQTDSTYEKQLEQATKKLIIEATRDSIKSQQRSFQLTHRYTQTSPPPPPKVIGEPSFVAVNNQIGVNDSLSIETSEKLGDVGSRINTLRKTKNRMQTSAHQKTMRLKVLNLTKQVASLKTAKEFLTKTTEEQKVVLDKTQSELTQSQQRLRISKQITERLTQELEDSTKKYKELVKTRRERKVPSYPTEKHLEDRLKLSTNECSRLSHELKSSRKLCGELEEKIKLYHEKCSRQDQVLNQKKVFVDELKPKLKATQEKLESTLEELKRAEEKSLQRKNQLDLVKRQLEVEIGQRQELEQLYEQSQKELNKKVQLLTKAQDLRHQAEVAVSEMEDAAKQQLHNLANQSQVTLKSIEKQLIISRQTIEELKHVVRALAEELIERITSQRILKKQERYERSESAKNKTSMIQACELASSILNMSKADIDELLDVEDEDSIIESEQEWKNKIENELSKQGSFSDELVRILLGMVDNLTHLQQETNPNAET